MKYLRRILLLCLGLTSLLASKAAESVHESARNIPLVTEVDVVVVGGSSGGVAAACEAAQRGARVLLVASKPYLGEDLCATLRLWLEPGEKPEWPLTKKLFAEGTPARPMYIKRVLDQALIEAGVEFVFSSFVTDVLRDERNEVAGIVMANRAGRQAVKAKIIIDASERATVARLAGARFEPFPSSLSFRRLVVGPAPNRSGLPFRNLELQWPSKDDSHSAWEFSFQCEMRDGSFRSFAQAEQQARDKTFHPKQVDAADKLFYVAPDAMHGRSHVSGDWPGTEQVSLDSFSPAGIKHLYVLGACADLPRSAAEQLMRPETLIALGARIGRVAAEQAKLRSSPSQVTLPGAGPRQDGRGDIREVLNGVRPTQKGLPGIPSAAHEVPVLGEYDVVVVGGGTSGAAAGISAARRGARTLVLEYLHTLGGVGTAGLICHYWHGFREGFTKQVDDGVSQLGAKVGVVGKAEWWRQELRRSGAEVWFGVLACGAWMEGNRFRGIVIATPDGRGVVLGKIIIDATGNADIAAAGGAPCAYTDGSDLSLQLAGLPPRNLGDSYNNTCFVYADETDLMDISWLLVSARDRFAGAYDLGQLIDTRERRTIIGEYVLTTIDQHAGRTFSDTISVHESNYDMYGFPTGSLYLLKAPPKTEVFRCFLPYRCLLPKGLEGLLVIGIGLSAERDAMPAIRTQADMQNLGYAAGLVAAIAAQSGSTLRAVDLTSAQKHLVEMGNLLPAVLTNTDSFPLPQERIEIAARGALDNYSDLAAILSQPNAALPILRQRYANMENGEARLIVARTLAVLGDASGAAALIDALKQAHWDSGSNIEAFGNRGAHYSRVDSIIVALGLTHDQRALRPILDKAEQLGPNQPLSHFRAIALALESFGHPSAAPIVAGLLRQEGVTGHAITNLTQARLKLGEQQKGQGRTAQHLNPAVRELVLARALYRCGDWQGQGQAVLRQYEQHVFGHLARHAQAVLKAKINPNPRLD